VPPPADIPDGRDDDIVARQIREAAEKETDPELREKLWDEYREYKTGKKSPKKESDKKKDEGSSGDETNEEPETGESR